MFSPRAAIKAVSLATLSLFAVGTGCGTDARGVEDCRHIEEARCSAAAACGAISDVGECQRFYRDQCLHGLPVASPGAPVVNACVEAIRAAGACASSSAESARQVCGSLRTPKLACDRIAQPETLPECAFLTPDAPPTSNGGAGGEAGAGGLPAVAAGAGGLPSSEGGSAGRSPAEGGSAGNAPSEGGSAGSAMPSEGGAPSAGGAGGGI